MIEQLREWADLLEQRMVPVESIIAALRDVANEEEEKMNNRPGVNMNLMIWTPELASDKEKYGATLVVQPVNRVYMGEGTFYTVDLRTPVHMAGTEVMDIPDFELKPL